jgi:hypothetical protein
MSTLLVDPLYIYSIIGRGFDRQPTNFLDCVVDGKIDSSRFLQYILHSPEDTNKLIQSLFLDSDDESDDESDVESDFESEFESDDQSDDESEAESEEDESEYEEEEMIREVAGACVRGKVEGERRPLPLKKRSWEVVERGVGHPLVCKSLSQELEKEMIRKVPVGTTNMPVTKKIRRE